MRKPKETHTCVICGKEFTHRRKGKNLCCSSACGIEYTKRTQSKPKEYRICQFCGKTFEVKRRNIPNMFCSHECQINSLKAREYPVDPEKQKAKEERKKEREKEKLRAAAQRKLIFIIKATIKEKQRNINRTSECPECGAIFEADKPNRTGKQYCSETCKRRHDNRRRDHRLEKCAVIDPTITLTKLYERDQGICQLCGGQTTFDTDPNSNEYPSIDHVTPISKGGTHEWGNVQLAHRGCNTKKKDNIPPPRQ